MTLMFLAFAAGVVATVDPCGFPLLPAFVGLCTNRREQGSSAVRTRNVAEGVLLGTAVTAGFVSVYVVASLLFAAGLRSVVGRAPWLSAAFGISMVAVGLAMLAGREFGLRLGPGAPRSGRGWRRMFAFGAAYAGLSLSCMLSLLLAVAAQAIAAHNPLAVIGVFAAHAAGSATVLMAVTVSTVGARNTVVSAVRTLLPVVGRLGGAVLVASGVYLAVM